VRTLRTARGWTQDDLARRLTAAGHPMHQSTLAKLELGTRPTDVAEITEIATIFGIQPAGLFEDPSADEQQVQRRREMRARLVEILEERSRLASRLQALDAEYDSITAELDAEYGRPVGKEVNDIGEH
jgi:transcriptional regulator with XRE-family HTH domain